MEGLVYWLFSGGFLLALTLHLLGSLLIVGWWFWRDENLLIWHGNLMLAALVSGIGGALFGYWLPTA